MSNDQRDDHNRLSPTRPRKPFMLGYSVRQGADGKSSHWSKIAAAWEHKDGEGYEVRMDAFPVDGRLVLRTISDDVTSKFLHEEDSFAVSQNAL